MNSFPEFLPAIVVMAFQYVLMFGVVYAAARLAVRHERHRAN
ncbi:MAG TPA: hypothetical protein VL225_10600 [Vicinamibacterales bacterium]|nr:hypothetical protein [Vicinamibacterales bacterium]